MDRPQSRGHYDCLLLIAVSALIFFFQLGVPPLWDRDEPRNAGCAAEMIAADDWVVPVFNAELRTHKPVLLYWLMMASYSVFGVNEFGARFVSASLGIGTVLLTYGMACRLFNRQIGRWAGIILASTIMFGVASRAATPDALLMFCGTLALAIFVLSAFPKDIGPDAAEVGLVLKSHFAAIAIYAAMGLGVLAKGPVGLVVPTAVIGMYLLIARLDGRDLPPGRSGRLLWILRPFEPMHFLRTCWAMRPITAIASASAVALPWYVWVTLRTDGVWTREFFWTHNVSRATETMEGHAGPPILFYVAAILVGFFPWSILTIPTGLHLYTRSEETDSSRHAIIFLVCWIGVYIGIFSLAQTKLPSYVTPCYPALAMLAGVFVCEWRAAADFRRAWLKVGLANLIGVGVLLLIALPIAATRFLPGSQWLGLLGLVPLIGGMVCWRLHSNGNHRSATTTLAYTAVAFSMFLMAIVPAEIGRHRRYEGLLQQTANHDGPIASFGHLEPSWIFYGRRPVHDFEMAETEEFLRFLERNPNTLVVTTPQRIEESSSQVKLFENYKLVHETEYFLRDRALVLIQANNASITTIADRRGVPTGLPRK